MGSATFLGVLLAVHIFVSGALRPSASSIHEEAESASKRLPLIPYPASVQGVAGAQPFKLQPGTKVDVGAGIPSEDFLVQDLKRHLAEVGAEEAGSGATAPSISLRLEEKALRGTESPEEGYSLDVDDAGVKLLAGSLAGLFNGVQTLKQLTHTNEQGAAHLPAVSIVDAPRFEWRGLHLDVSRHFQNVSEVTKLINTMSMFKLNRFHWHLTDDQGWRIPIDGYPKLTEVGATGHGGRQAYTKEDIKAVVAYAQERHIQVIPEIDVPGHAAAAIAAYPSFANSDIPHYKLPKTPILEWGQHDFTLAPNDAVWTFLDNVYDTLVELFPGEHLHLGGDEVTGKEWNRSPKALALASSAEPSTNSSSVMIDVQPSLRTQKKHIQSMFNRKTSELAHARGRTPIGWDEVQDIGGLSEEGIVMGWRGSSEVYKAAMRGRRVINCAQEALYFDWFQGSKLSEPEAFGGTTTLATVYDHDPIPQGLTEEQKKLVLGAQGQLWSEFMSTASHMQYMAFPRALALAERTWTPSSQISGVAEFKERLGVRLGDLDRLGVNYRPLSLP